MRPFSLVVAEPQTGGSVHEVQAQLVDRAAGSDTLGLKAVGGPHAGRSTRLASKRGCWATSSST